MLTTADSLWTVAMVCSKRAGRPMVNPLSLLYTATVRQLVEYG